MPCRCVHLRVFEECREKYIACFYRVDLKARTYRADFEAIARRVATPEEYADLYRDYLTTEPRRLRPYCYYRRMETVRAHVGRAFMMTRPYPLWPLDEYFTFGDEAKLASYRNHPAKEAVTDVEPRFCGESRWRHLSANAKWGELFLGD